MCVPYVWNHPAVNQENLLSQDWFGTIEPIQYGSFIDNYLFLCLGGISSQVRGPFRHHKSICPSFYEHNENLMNANVSFSKILNRIIMSIS